MSHYTSSHRFHGTITDAAGVIRQLPLFNGQYTAGSGRTLQIETRQELPAFFDPLPAGSYTLEVIGERGGYIRDGQKIVTWPAMRSASIEIVVIEDPDVLSNAESALLRRAKTDHNVKFISQIFGVSREVKYWLNALLRKQPELVWQHVGKLRHVRRLPKGGGELLKQAMTLRTQLEPEERRILELAHFARNVGGDEALDALLILARSNANEFLRQAAIDNLQDFTQPRAEEALLELATDPSKRLSRSAYRGLARWKNPNALRVLLDAATSKDSDDRIFAACSLKYFLDDAHVKERLDQLKQDENENVRSWANQSLRLGPDPGEDPF